MNIPNGAFIESVHNPTIKRLASLQQKKYRDKEKLFLLEGQNFVDDIPTDWPVECFCIASAFRENHPIASYEARAPVVYCTDKVFQSLSDTQNPQGILAVCHTKDYDWQSFLSAPRPFLVMAENLNDPGNLGTIIRTADAAGAAGILLSAGSAELHSPKVLRASAGSLLHLPHVTGLDFREVIPVLQRSSVQICAAHLKGCHLPYDVDMRGGTAILIGNEAHGLSPEVSAMADTLVKLPMLGGAESLNASVACGILLYEVVRQRLSI